MTKEELCNEELEFPDFDKIIMHCKTLMSLKFPQYGNSWIGRDYEFGTQALQFDNKFWQERLKDEVDDPKANTIELCDTCHRLEHNGGDYSMKPAAIAMRAYRDRKKASN